MASIAADLPYLAAFLTGRKLTGYVAPELRARQRERLLRVKPGRATLAHLVAFTRTAVLHG